MRLVKSGLMFGNLIAVTSPALVERYNRALKHLIDRETTLTEFHMDISGYSPEIGHEFGDDLYLNPKGCNRMFILLTTEQKTAPLLNSHFSTSRSILRNYITENEDQLFALTAREAVAGELMNSVFSMETPEDLLRINQIDVEADTVEEHVAEANLLGGYVDRFMTERDAWWDDVLIADMIELAKKTGDIHRNPLALKTLSYAQGNYYTDHFGGVYIFRDTQTATLIARTPIEGLHDLPIENILTFDDRDGIAEFLRDEGLSELIVQRRDQESAAIIRQKMDFIVITTAAALGHDLRGVTRRSMRMLERRYANDMPPEFHGLMDVLRWASMGSAVPKIDPQHPAYFYALRASQHADRDLINMLLTDLSRLDFRQLFICHKPLFYAAYSSWTDAKKDYVVQFISEEYAMDKVGAREALFGTEPTMEDVNTSSDSEALARLERETRVSKRENPWGGALVMDDNEPDKHRKKGRGLREELDWDRKSYRNRPKSSRNKNSRDRKTSRDKGKKGGRRR